jgi:diketogulonate reductase-like aldo/keto reductase
MIQRVIPSSGEKLPVIGLGTWQTFDVDTDKYQDLKNVLDEMYSAGGRLIDSSPMYGKSEKTIGNITANISGRDDFFYATKVWTTGMQQGIQQMETSMARMKRKTIDLVQIHNLTDWRTHLKTLRAWKEEGRIRYFGITHYTDAFHDDLERIMKAERPDFVQFNYSVTSRNAEKRLLDAASTLGIATLVNRPFGEGKLFGQVKGKPLPPWAADYDMHSWSVYFLKYIISHPAVTCVIPATSSAQHEKENVSAGTGELPDGETRKRMVEYLVSSGNG